jgi:N6-adenosine-specific RNA methylase IME4
MPPVVDMAALGRAGAPLASVIVADPPWRYERAGRSGGIDHHYESLSVADLRAMPVARYGRKNCALLLWATPAKLNEAVALGEAWGFTYRTVFVTWIKTCLDGVTPVTGMGYYTRQSAEYVLLFSRGRTAHLVRSHSVNSTLIARRGKHSEKPASFWPLVRRVFGDITCTELFARTPVEGVTCFGNQLCPPHTAAEPVLVVVSSSAAAQHLESERADQPVPRDL